MQPVIKEIMNNVIRNVLIILSLALMIYIYKSINAISIESFMKLLSPHMPFFIILCIIIYVSEYITLNFSISNMAINLLAIVLCILFAVEGVMYLSDLLGTNEHAVPAYVEIEEDVIGAQIAGQLISSSNPPNMSQEGTYSIGSVTTIEDRIEIRKKISNLAG